ncbi:MAG TPA: hypothetical protein VF530_17055 [Planctomycetota bacterium]
MVSVALIGADGAGKSSLARALAASTELPIQVLYMGANSSANGHALPTTRAVRALERALGRARAEGGPPDPTRRQARPARGLARAARTARTWLALANRLCEEAHRTALARRLERRGFLVVLDRLFLADYWAHDVVGADRTRAQRLHGRFLRRLPQPDCTILLDAPAEVLFARKAEGRLEWVARRRQEYLELLPALRDCRVVDATRPAAEVRAEVLDILRRLWRGEGAAR